MNETKLPTTPSVFLAALLAVALGIGCFAAGWGIGYTTGRNEKSNFDRSIELTVAAIANDTVAQGRINRIIQFINTLNSELDALDEDNGDAIQATEQSSEENAVSDKGSGQFHLYLKKDP